MTFFSGILQTTYHRLLLPILLSSLYSFLIATVGLNFCNPPLTSFLLLLFSHFPFFTCPRCSSRQFPPFSFYFPNDLSFFIFYRVPIIKLWILPLSWITSTFHIGNTIYHLFLYIFAWFFTRQIPPFFIKFLFLLLLKIPVLAAAPDILITPLFLHSIRILIGVLYNPPWVPPPPFFSVCL